MIFTPDHARLVCEGKKTQTRRLVKPGDKAEIVGTGRGCVGVKGRNGRWRWRVDGREVGIDWFTRQQATSNAYGGTATYRQPNYAVQEGRGKPAICRFTILSIRRECIQDITEDDAIAEGCRSSYEMPYAPGHKAFYNPNWMTPEQKAKMDAGHRRLFVPPGPVARFAATWDVINNKAGSTWYENPEVWVLTIRRYDLPEQG